MKRFSTYNMLLVGISVVVLTVALVLLISIRQSQRVRTTARLVSHTEEVLNHIQKIVTVALDNETAARGFIITGQDKFLEQIYDSENNFKEEIKILRELVADNLKQLGRLDTLEKCISGRVIFSQQMVNIMKKSGKTAAGELVESGQGKKYTDSIRINVERMESSENQLLIDRKKRNDTSISSLNSILYVMLGFVVILSVFIIRRIKTDIDRQKQNQQRFISLLDAAPDATVIVDEKGIIRMVNKQTEKLFSLTRDQLIDKSIELLIPHEQAEKYIFDHSNFVKAAELSVPIELEAQKKDADPFPVEVSLSPIKTKEGVLVSIALRDITDRKKAAEQLAFMARLMENTSEPVFATDADFNILTWNRAAEKLYGYTTNEAVGQSTSLLRPQIEQAQRMEIRKEMREKGSWSGEVIHLKKDGTPVFLLISNTASYNSVGEHEGYVNVGRDISDRKKSEDAIRDLNATLERRVEDKTREIMASERQLRHTLDNMLEGAQIIDYEWRYVYVNDSLTRHGKYKKEELIGYTVMEKYPGIERTEIFKVYERCFNERVSIHLENEFEFPDKTKGWFELSFQPVPEGIFILSMDITDRKKAQEEIMKLNEDLEHKVMERTVELQLANKELESFTYSVSHDLRAPLRIIDGYSDILVTDYKEVMDDEANRVLGVIKANARRMGQLIDDLLNLSQVGRKELVIHQTDMNHLVRSVIDEQLEFSHSNAVIDLENLEPSVCDSSLIRQVWINLVSNAIKYSSKNPSPVIKINSIKNKDEVIYTISDNGVGFDMKYQDKLFGVFQRLHKVSEFEGTGIGLALVNRILIKHKGKIWAQSEPGKGAIFSFSLPVPDLSI